MTSAPAPLLKMNGIGNKIIVADMRGRADKVTPQAAIALNRAPAMSFDQLMVVYDPKHAETNADIVIFNCDGSEAEACGNGTRCVVAWLHRETAQTQFTFTTKGGLLQASIEDIDHISVDMGVPRFDWEQIPLAEEFADTRNIELQIGPIDDPIVHTPSVANMGNPHAIFWVDRDPHSYELDRFGPLLEFHPIFPEQANITLAQITGDDEILMRTWERGAGLTLACGSAACATAVSAARTGRTGRNVWLTLPGGKLHIAWREDQHVIMTGAAEFEFEGSFMPVSGELV